MTKAKLRKAQNGTPYNLIDTIQGQSATMSGRLQDGVYSLQDSGFNLVIQFTSKSPRRNHLLLRVRKDSPAQVAQIMKEWKNLEGTATAAQ